MAKWKEPTKTELVAQPLSVDPRVRMKEIRADVAMFNAGSNPWGISHLGELPENFDDARRVIVAVQDLFEDARNRHRKATTHICELVHMLDHASDEIDNAAVIIQMQSQQIAALKAQLEGAEKHIYHQRDDLRKANHERDAVLTTMKLMNQQPKPEQETSMSMVMGHSNGRRF